LYDIGYRPQLENVPQFKTLTRLEGLINTADDITWQGNKFAKQRLAPSHTTFKDLPTLDALILGFQDDVKFDDEEVAPPPIITKTNAIIPKTNANIANNNNKPNNTNAQSPMNQNQQKQNNMASNNNANRNVNNQQPQKPPAPESIIEKKNEEGGDDNSRNALLEQIRKGGQLKAASSGRKEKKAKPPPIVAKPSLMDVLKDRLAERNRLISGGGSSNDNENKAAKKLDHLGTSTSQKTDSVTEDKTGLGLHNIPIHMRESVKFVDTDDHSDARSWDE